MAAEDLIPALQTAVSSFNSTVDDKQAVIDGKVSSGATAKDNAQSALTAAKAAQDAATQSSKAALRDTLSAKANVDHQDLAALAASKAVTAVDVFVYDTSKDSDGGAWRKRCTKLSWYNEPLNTATRGSRREFPSVAVIVADATNVTIYDGDDPSLPMWMVFTGLDYTRGTFLGYAVNNTVSSATQLAIKAHALNGTLALGVIAVVGNGNITGYRQVNFSVDKLIVHGGIGAAQMYAVSGKGVGDRNSDFRNSSLGVPIGTLVNRTINDVAMTALPDAPIDPATGLPVPTIAVATQGGLSVIGNDGAVQSVAPILYANHNYVKNVLIKGEEVFFTAWSSTQQHTAAVYDIRTLSFKREYQTYAPLGKVVTPFENVIGITISKLAYTSSALALGTGPNPVNSACPFKGVGLIAENRTDRAKGMSAILASTYNTGWMPGDIKGAFLSDNDDTDLVANQIVTDPTFDTGDGWTIPNPENGTWTIANGVARCTSGSVVFLSSPQLTAGKRYVLTFEIKNYVSGSVRPYNDGSVAYVANVVGNGVYTYTFVASSGTFKFVGYETDNLDLDNVYIWEADADRSVNNKSLIFNGTITRTPVATGADLVAYSGFSGSNWLEQPYNPALNFGTGDFSIMGWAKFSSLGIYQGILARTNKQGGNAGTTDTFYIRLLNTGALAIYFWNGSATTSTTTSGVAPFGPPVFWAITRKDGVLQWYLNGVPSGAPVNDGSDFSNLVDGTEVLMVGKEYFAGGGFAAGNTSLALLRISATAPTAEQIAKIYNDEKVLFQEGAQATLYGTSNAVTALAHDPDTGLLHVGTSQGRSVFKGLRRVDNTTTAVGTAISAVNGMVVEE